MRGWRKDPNFLLLFSFFFLIIYSMLIDEWDRPLLAQEAYAGARDIRKPGLRFCRWHLFKMQGIGSRGYSARMLQRCDFSLQGGSLV